MEEKTMRPVAKHASEPKLRFPEFQNAGGWEEKKLGEISQIVRGGSPRPIENYLTTDAKGLNWLKIGDVSQEEKYVTHTKEKVCVDALTKTREVNPNDLILSNSMSFGRPYILKIKTCIHDGWIAVSKIDNSVNVDYLYYFILSPSSQSYFSNNAAGSGVQNLNADIIKLLPTSIPKLPEQQKIANCLSSIDELTTAEAKKLDTLKAHKKGLMQQLFPAEGETLPKLRFPEFRDAGDWEKKVLGQIGDVLMCKRIFAEETNHTEGVPFFKIGTLGGKSDAFISKKLFDEYKSKYNFPRKGEILITCSGTVGKCLLYDGKDAYYQDSNIVWIDNPTLEVSNEFLHKILLNVDWGTLNSTTITRIYGSDLRNLSIIFPTNQSEQQKIADCISSIDKLITAQTQKLDALKAHKLGLMQQLFPALDEVNE